MMLVGLSGKFHSAAANAKHYGLDKKKIIDEFFADEGPKLKEFDHVLRKSV
jgi:ribosomal protein L22